MKHFRILSYNIHKGVTQFRRQKVIDSIRKTLRSTDADLLCLQEVQGANEISEAQFEFLADQHWPHFSYGKNAVTTSGHHGNAILSKFEIKAWKNYDLSINRFEQRGLLLCQIGLPDGSLLPIYTTHLNLREKDRNLQLETICEIINSSTSRDEPLILAGDFNDWKSTLSDPLKAELNLNEAFSLAEGEHARTFPSFAPQLRLDRIYFRGLQLIECKSYQEDEWKKLSDHLAVSADFKISTQSSE